MLFTISAFSDMLDGPIARYRGQITHFGEKYDPFADILLILSTGLLLYNIDTFKYFYLYLLMEIIRLLITPILYKYIYKIKLHQYSGVFGKIKMFLISSSL
ncbi:MAG: CDP-alcohol phosphatidyltransferase family protein [Cyanobium sp. MAG06]|nr:CDP-alcohol phosphatidyltransferase family protein [Cyanobium sp. MAG06]